jgi:flagellar basal-body rod protein FlgC
MGLFDAIEIAGSGLTAERLRMDVTAENLANAQTTRGADGGPYRRREVVLQDAGAGSFDQILVGEIGGVRGTERPAGVHVAGIVEDQQPPRQVYDPGHPDADAQGYVALPNVNPVTEMVNLISASRAYEANVTALQSAKLMFTRTLELLR